MRFTGCYERLTAIADDRIFEAVRALCWDCRWVAAVRATPPALGGFEVWRYRNTIIEDKTLTFEDTAVRELFEVLQNPTF